MPQVISNFKHCDFSSSQSFRAPIAVCCCYDADVGTILHLQIFVFSKRLEFHLCSFLPDFLCEEQPLPLRGVEKEGVQLLWVLKPSKGFLLKSPFKKENLPQRILSPNRLCLFSLIAPHKSYKIHMEPVIVVSEAATGSGPAQRHGLLPAQPWHPPGANQWDVWARKGRGHDFTRLSSHPCCLWKGSPKREPYVIFFHSSVV